MLILKNKKKNENQTHYVVSTPFLLWGCITSISIVQVKPEERLVAGLYSSSIRLSKDILLWTMTLVWQSQNQRMGHNKKKESDDRLQSREPCMWTPTLMLSILVMEPFHLWLMGYYVHVNLQLGNKHQTLYIDTFSAAIHKTDGILTFDSSLGQFDVYLFWLIHTILHYHKVRHTT